MKKIGIGIFCLLSLVSLCFAVEQASTDIPASVEVLPVFSLSLDRNLIDFGVIEPGSSKVLGEGGYFNEIHCRSNYGRTWHLKAEIVSGPQLLGKDSFLPHDTFSFKVASAQAEAEIQASRQFQPLDKSPALIYASQGEENIGREVILRMQYKFSPPPDAPAGTYAGGLLFTMTDTP